MDTNEQLNELIHVQSAIIVDCYLILKDISFLSATDHSSDIANIIASDRFFIRTGNYMWTILVLELNKLFDKREDYNLSKSLNIVINNQQKIKWSKGADLIDVLALMKEIEGEKVQTIIKNLNYIRDKQIAHLDRNRFNQEILIHLEEAKSLADLGQKTLSEINWRLNGAGLGLDVEFLGLCEMTIRKLVALNKIRT